MFKLLARGIARSTNSRYALLLITSILASPVSLADKGEVDENMIVEATRVEESPFSQPGSVTLIDRAMIQRARQQLGLDESLARVPGLFLQNRYNFAQDLRVSIRGFGARSNFGIRGVKILVDGIPETLVDGQGQIDSIDLGTLHQVEVLRGGASSLYGNASGGVINIISESGAAVPFVETRLAVGEEGYSKYQLKAGGQFDKGDYFISASELESDGYRAHSEAENRLLSAKFRLRPDDVSQFTLNFSATDQPLANDPGGITREQMKADPTQARDRNVDYDAGEELEQYKIGLGYQRTLPDKSVIAARAYYLDRDFANKLPFTGGGSVAFDRIVAGAGLSYTREFDVGGHWNRLIVGLDYDRQDDDRRRFDNEFGRITDKVFDQNELITSTGLFIQDEFRLTDRMELTLGVRYDHIEFEVDDDFLADGNDSGNRDFDEISPMLGFIYEYRPVLQLFGNISSVFETPTSTEFAKPDGSGGFNSNLDPQQARNYELGLRGEFAKRYRYQISLFHIDVEDELIPFEVPASPDREFFLNAGESSRDGLEIALTGEPLAGVTFALAYTWSDFEFDRFIDNNGNDFGGNEIPGIPTHSAFAELEYQHDSGLFAAVDALYVDELFVNNANSANSDSYVVANFRLGYRGELDQLVMEPFLGITNLSDEDYAANVRINAFGARYFEPGPERTIYGGLRLRYNY